MWIGGGLIQAAFRREFADEESGRYVRWLLLVNFSKRHWVKDEIDCLTGQAFADLLHEEKVRQS